MSYNIFVGKKSYLHVDENEIICKAQQSEAQDNTTTKCKLSGSEKSLYYKSKTIHVLPYWGPLTLRMWLRKAVFWFQSYYLSVKNKGAYVLPCDEIPVASRLKL